jgi:hypothetical protein
MGAFGEVIVVRGDRLDIVALALRLGADRPAAIDRSQGGMRILLGRTDREGVADQDGGNAPVGDGAGRVAVERFAERLRALGKPKEWSKATPRSKLSCACGAQELAKATSPSCLGGASSSCAHADGIAANDPSSKEKASARCFIAGLHCPFEGYHIRLSPAPAADLRPAARSPPGIDQDRQRVGDLFAAALAGESLGEFSRAIDEIDE